MGLWDFVVLVLIAGICGFVASQLMGAKRMNIVLMIVVGFIGALIGRWIADYFGLPLLVPIQLGARSFPLVWAIVGSIVLVGITTFIQQH